MKTSAVFVVLLLASCTVSLASADDVCSTVEILEFNGDSANQTVTIQVDFGPRLPGSNASMELRKWFMETRPAFDWRLDSHSREGYNLTNLEGKLVPENVQEGGPIVVLAAHYDSRDRAERDQNPNMTAVPIPGANDGGSGVAVLWELARLVPSMNLEHEVWILLTDAEDQGPTPSMLGAKAWAENRTNEDIARIEAFLLVDMIGDADLKIYRTFPPSPTNEDGNRLWNAVEQLAQPLGLIDNLSDCDGNPGMDVVNFSRSDGVIDDHVPMLNVGIPAIDFIDIRYGENATEWGGYWHTHEDTPDKVSAESLAHIGRLLELGLRQGSWLKSDNSSSDANASESDGLEVDSVHTSNDEASSKQNIFIAGATFAAILLIFTTLVILHQGVRLKR